MSIIFKALQKSRHKPSQDNENIIITKENKKNKSVFLVPILIIVPLLVLFSHLFFSIRYQMPVEEYPSIPQEEYIISDHQGFSHEPVEIVSLPEATQTGRMFFLEELQGKFQPEIPVEEIPPLPAQTVPEEISVHKPEMPAPEYTSKEIVKEVEEPKKEAEPAGIKEEQRAYSSSIDYTRYNLQGIAGDERGYLAIINDRIVGEGDHVNGAEIILVTRNFVELLKNGEYFRIYQ